MKKKLEINNKKINYSLGFTLVEFLVYIGVFSFISILAVNMFLTISSAFVEIRANHELSRSAFLVMEKITREIKSANSINGSSSLGSSASSLILNGLDSSGNPRTVSFSISGGQINFYENENLIGGLLTNTVSVNSFLVRNVTTNVSSALKIELALSFNRGSVVKTENFYSTVILRGGY